MMVIYMYIAQNIIAADSSADFWKKNYFKTYLHNNKIIKKNMKTYTSKAYCTLVWLKTLPHKVLWALASTNH